MLNSQEKSIFKRLDSPMKIQDFLDTLKINFEEDGFTYFSPRRILRERKAHCLEGALLAAAVLWSHGKEPLLLDLKTTDEDQDHVVALYKQNGYWGAISKTNHVSLRFRDPIYRNIHELVASYFHEYFMNEAGKKTLLSYSRSFNLKKFGQDWITAEENLDEIAEALDHSRHFPIIPQGNKKFIRPASQLERQAGELMEWLA